MIKLKQIQNQIGEATFKELLKEKYFDRSLSKNPTKEELILDIKAIVNFTIRKTIEVIKKNG